MIINDIPGNRAEVFTFGFNPAVAPPIPPASDTRVQSLGPGQSGYSFNGEDSISDTGGRVFALGPRVKLVEWSYSFDTPASSATVVLQASNDSINFWTIDFSFNPDADVKTVRTGAAFVRIGTGTVEEGIPLTGQITAKP